jgi:hypothetical protein
MTYVIHIKAMDIKAIHFSYAYSYKNPRGERRRANRVSLPRPEAGRHDPRVRSRYKIVTSTSTASSNRRFFSWLFPPSEKKKKRKNESRRVKKKKKKEENEIQLKRLAGHFKS